MNFKLKGIELDAFRIYQNKQFFNFLTNTGEVANLIVIYAPNGYGKTSFIDAVEWALTGNINRISKNTILKKTADNEKGLILKNIKSEKEYGTVKLIAEGGGLLEKKTKVIGGNRKTDYADGDLIFKSDVFKKINYADFSTKSILGQDKIDSFLRSISPKDRYDTLTNFWDDENDSELFKRILNLYSESEKQLKQVKEDLGEITKEIQSLVIRPSIMVEINNLVEKFNQIKSKELSLPELNTNNNKRFINALIETKSKLESAMEENNKKVLTAQYLTKNFEAYNDKKNILINITEDMKFTKNILDKYKKKEKRTNTLNSIVYEAYNLYEKYRKIKKLIKLHNKTANLQKKIIDFEEKNSKLVKEISTNNSQKTKQEHILNETKVKLDNIQNLKKDIEYRYSKLDSNLEGYFYIRRKKAHLSQRLLLLKEMINIRQIEIQKYKKQMLTLNSYRDYEVKDIININIDNKNITSLVMEISKSYKFIQQKELELKELNQEYNQFGKLNEQINTIYKVGKKFIEESRTTSCPLCKKEYDDFESLVRSVDKDFKDIDILNKMKSKIVNLELGIKDEKNRVNKFTDLYRKEIDKELKVLSIMDIESETKISSYNSLNQRMNNKLNNIKKEESDLISFFNKLNIDIEDSSNENIADIKSSILGKINNLSKTILDYENKVNETSESIKKITTILKQKEVEYVSNKNKIREIREDSILKSFNQVLSELKIGSNIEKIKETSVEVKEKFLLKVNNKRSISNEIYNLDIDLFQYNEQDINDKYMELQNSHQEVRTYIDNYNLELDKLRVSNPSSKEELIQIHADLSNQISSANSALNILNDLMGFTNYIENNIESKTKESKKRELEDSLAVLEKGNEELSNAKEYITNYIENKINNSFNLESINSIYQRIDPHPDFNNIKFESDLSKDKPEINIYASDRKEKLAPILYFSAAQVNILSLSIFLAKALLKDHDGLNTIFMDDPIQHLDNLNILSFIDLLRTITNQLDKQVILSTHNENFYKLIKRKMDPEYTKSKFIELESFGKIRNP
ncbi:AAA family ATPase [Salinibacillus xinjiangensis]|uniref:Nuclease SbcCD subunit C n=1 Tax=Salinibacillus xinjiangensis TaxID=1229268 RepID=A0A6G1XA68_9BACI|nr:AAA family ATPase [Salinibacillus xinjiangensis]MRG87911.1 AAA family ATPase [Salinibacillus xinjiangensis]